MGISRWLPTRIPIEDPRILCVLCLAHLGTLAVAHIVRGISMNPRASVCQRCR